MRAVCIRLAPQGVTLGCRFSFVLTAKAVHDAQLRLQQEIAIGRGQQVRFVYAEQF